MRLNWHYLRWSLKIRMLIACSVWLIVAIAAFFASTTGHQVIHWCSKIKQQALEKADFKVHQIEVNWTTPAHYTKTEEILKTIHVTHGESMSNIHLSTLQQDIEKLPWVRTAIVERYLPNKLTITVDEKMPIALWQHNRQYHPLDERAQIIHTTTQLPADLLLVVGPDAPQHLIPLIQNLEQVPDIYQYVRAAIRVRERRWNLKLFNAEKGLEILLPEKEVLTALQRLDAHNKKEKLIKRQIAGIDLRTHDKVILKPIPSPQQKPKAPQK